MTTPLRSRLGTDTVPLQQLPSRDREGVVMVGFFHTFLRSRQHAVILSFPTSFPI